MEHLKLGSGATALGDTRLFLADMAYAAALDDTLWPDWVAEAASAIGVTGATFAVVNARTGEIRQMIPLWGSADPAEYFTHYHQYDPQLPKILSIDRPTLYASEDYVDEGVVETAEYMAWQRGTSGFDCHITAATPLNDDGWRVVFSGFAALSTGPVAAAGRNVLRRLLPDLVRAWQLGFTHGEMLASSFWDGLAARRGDGATLLLDERGRMIRATDRALTIVGTSDGLSLRQGELIAATPAEQARLVALIGQAVSQANPSAGAMQVTRRSGRRPLVLIAYPLVRTRRFLAPFEAAAMVRIVDPAPPDNASDLFRVAYALTPREADLARLLGQGHSSESAAVVLGIALATARIHLHNIFGKTGTARQSDLVQIYTRIGN